MSDDLPRDPDIEVEESGGTLRRPAHLRSVYLLIVLVGGTCGTAAREAVSLAFPAVNGIPYAIFGINVVGAFLLGVLLETLARRGPDLGARRSLRLLLGTGLLGGFTTYSALAADAALLVAGGLPGAGVLYGAATVLTGAASTWAGIAVAVAARAHGTQGGRK